MANVLGELFGGIADAIRDKGGASGTMKPASFPGAIRAIPAQGSPTEQEVLARTTLEGFVREGELMILETTADYTLSVGETYFVVWDGVAYECVGQDMSVVTPGAVGLGDLRLYGGTANGEPFALGAVEGMALYATLDEALSHTVRIYQHPFGSLEDLRYVSFRSHDGRELYGRKAVARGDDCADPLVRGLFDTPTRQTTDQYSYTFDGWSRWAGGSVDDAVLREVNANRTLYAHFDAAVRHYTVTYYDIDETTVLRTESLPYGTVPTYVPVKVGYTFTGWTREPEPVTGAAAYYATWLEKMDFGALTWAQISQYCQTEDVSELFSIGQRKTFSFRTASSGPYTAMAEIVDFYHDDLADGSGKAPITLRLLECHRSMHDWNSTGTSTRDKATWEASGIRQQLNTLATSTSFGLDADMRSVMKKVTKTYRVYGGGYATTDDFWFLPSLAELGYEIDGVAEGTCYAAYTGGKTLDGTYPELRYVFSDGTVWDYWTRTKIDYGKSYGIDTGGKAESVAIGSSSTERCGLVFMCVG